MNDEFEEKKSHKGCCLGIILALIIIGAIIGIIVYIAYKEEAPNNNDKKPLSRPANTSDISITMSDEISLSSIYKLKAYKDISNLQITMHFFDSKHTLIVSKIKIIGNVKEGQETTFKFGITDFSFSELWDMAFWNYEITGGTVSYFA